MTVLRRMGLVLAAGAVLACASCRESGPEGASSPSAAKSAPSRPAASRFAPAGDGSLTAALSPEPPALPTADLPLVPDRIDPSIPPDLPHLKRLFPKESRKLVFAIFGDRFWGDSTGWTTFDRAVEEVNRMGVDFVIDVGDHISGMTFSSEMTAQEWKEYLDHAGRSKVPWFFTPGNHDIYGREMYDYWRKNLGRTYYSFDRQGCHFLVLNTEEGEGGAGGYGFTAAQIEWAKEDVAAMGSPRHVFVFMHEPYFLFEGYGEGSWSDIAKALKGKPYTVFAGHYHRLEKSVRDGRPYFLLGPCGAGFYGEPARANGVFQHYTIVTVDGPDVDLKFIEPGFVHGEEVLAPPRAAEPAASDAPAP